MIDLDQLDRALERAFAGDVRTGRKRAKGTSATPQAAQSLPAPTRVARPTRSERKAERRAEAARRAAAERAEAERRAAAERAEAERRAAAERAEAERRAAAERAEAERRAAAERAEGRRTRAADRAAVERPADPPDRAAGRAAQRAARVAIDGGAPRVATAVAAPVEAVGPPAPASAREGRRRARRSAPPPVAPRELTLSEHAELIPRLLAEGRLAEADDHIAAHAALATVRGSRLERTDAATWDAMRSLLAGRHEEISPAVELAFALARQAGDVQAGDRHWAQRFWTGLEWGDEEEQCRLLDHCRERAYRYDDIVWRGNLTLLLARLRRFDEARRELEATLDNLGTTPSGLWSPSPDVLSNLAEAAFLVDDATRAAQVGKLLSGVGATLIVVDKGWVCKGATDRYRAHVAAASRNLRETDKLFASAVAIHRDLGAEPLLARALREWGCTLIGRDDALARRYLDQSAELAARLRLRGLAAPPAALAG